MIGRSALSWYAYVSFDTVTGEKDGKSIRLFI